MQKVRVVKIAILLLITFLFPIIYVKCENWDCEYPDLNNLVIEYPQGKIKNSDFINSVGSTFEFPSIVSYGKQKYDSTDDIRYPGSLDEKYTKVCPDKMKVCEEVKLLSGDVTLIPSMFTFAAGVIEKIIQGDSEVFTFNKRILHIMTQQEYDASYLKNYESSGGGINMEVVEDYKKIKEKTGGESTGFLSSTAAFFGSGIKMLVYDMLIGGERIEYIKVKCYTGNYSGPYATFNVNCRALESQFMEYDSFLEKYKQCGEEKKCKRNNYTELKSIEDNIKGVCKSYFANYNYNETQGPCLDSCLKIKDILNNKRKGTDLYEDYSNHGDACSLSTSVISSIYNILKWGKYIAPALIIMFTMLDFIKAIASQNDDDVKKAQGKFIKRLIIAAILFLLPLIINFVLQTFGLYYKNCDVTNLFSKN